MRNRGTAVRGNVNTAVMAVMKVEVVALAIYRVSLSYFHTFITFQSRDFISGVRVVSYFLIVLPCVILGTRPSRHSLGGLRYVSPRAPERGEAALPGDSRSRQLENNPDVLYLPSRRVRTSSRHSLFAQPAGYNDPRECVNKCHNFLLDLALRGMSC